MYIKMSYGILNTDTGEILYNAYVVNFIINGKIVADLLYQNLVEAINISCYYLKTLSYKVDQIQIYKNDFLIAEINK